MTFHVGQKVTQVCEWPAPPWPGEAAPTFGVVYTVREVADFGGFGCGLLLCEIVNLPRACGEVAFRTEYFRPVIERKTDISIFTAMLNPTLAPKRPATV